MRNTATIILNPGGHRRDSNLYAGYLDIKSALGQQLTAHVLRRTICSCADRLSKPRM
jgi:hypothetical protein